MQGLLRPEALEVFAELKAMTDKILTDLFHASWRRRKGRPLLIQIHQMKFSKRQSFP
jgi:hypothetical protein